MRAGQRRRAAWRGGASLRRDDRIARLDADEPWEARTDRQWRIRGRRSRRFYSYADILLKSSVRRRRMAVQGQVDRALDAEIDAARQALHVLENDVEP